MQRNQMSSINFKSNINYFDGEHFNQKININIIHYSIITRNILTRRIIRIYDLIKIIGRGSRT